MNIITGKKGSGKTSEVIKESSRLQVPILVPYEKMKDTYKDMARDLGVFIPEPLTFSEARSIRGRNLLSTSFVSDPPLKVLIDDLDYFMDEILSQYLETRVNILGGSLESSSNEIKEVSNLFDEEGYQENWGENRPPRDPRDICKELNRLADIAEKREKEEESKKS